MNIYTTIIEAIDPLDRQLKMFVGPRVPGITFEDAENFCQINGLGYCEVRGILISEILCIKGTNDPDWDSITDFDIIGKN